MPVITTANYTVTTTASLICDGDPAAIRLHIHNTDNTTPMYFGATSAVTSSTGYRVDGKDKLSFNLAASQQVWAITASGSATISVLRIPQ